MKFKTYLTGLNEGSQLPQEKLDESVQQSLQRIVDELVNAGQVVQTAHWNLRSSAFVAIHPWFGETYSALFAMADEVAEQIKISDINLMVNVSSLSTVPASDEQLLFEVVLGALESVKSALMTAANDLSLSRVLQNLIDGWIAQIDKMIWFIKASQK